MSHCNAVAKPKIKYHDITAITILPTFTLELEQARWYRRLVGYSMTRRDPTVSEGMIEESQQYQKDW
jgi:hypothetical protein